jgi:hypothetical protein
MEFSQTFIICHDSADASIQLQSEEPDRRSQLLLTWEYKQTPQNEHL